MKIMLHVIPGLLTGFSLLFFSCSGNSDSFDKKMCAPFTATYQRLDTLLISDREQAVDSISKIGVIHSDHKKYAVFSVFSRIKVASGFRGQSKLVFFHAHGNYLVYPLNLPEELPNGINQEYIYKNGRCTTYNSNSETICDVFEPVYRNEGLSDSQLQFFEGVTNNGIK